MARVPLALALALLASIALAGTPRFQVSWAAVPGAVYYSMRVGAKGLETPQLISSATSLEALVSPGQCVVVAAYDGSFTEIAESNEVCPVTPNAPSAIHVAMSRR